MSSYPLIDPSVSFDDSLEARDPRPRPAERGLPRDKVTPETGMGWKLSTFAGRFGEISSDLAGAALDWVRREMSELRQFELAIGAADLLAHGHSPGPPIGRALKQTLAARLDGRIGPGGELDYALQVLDEDETA